MKGSSGIDPCLKSTPLFFSLPPFSGQSNSQSQTLKIQYFFASKSLGRIVKAIHLKERHNHNLSDEFVVNLDLSRLHKMPQDLPGYYYDAEKNRYFPVKGPIPGSSRNSHAAFSSAPKSAADTNSATRNGIRTAGLLHVRELCGNVITSRKGKVNFQEQCQKIQASHPTVCKYPGTRRFFDCALGHAHAYIDTPDGSTETEILLAAGSNGQLCLYEVGSVEQRFGNGVKYMPDRVWPLNVEKQSLSVETLGHLWKPAQASILMYDITSMKVTKNENSPVQRALFTTLGSEISGGSVYLMNLMEPINTDPSASVVGRIIRPITSFSSTVWTADCNLDGSRAVIGSNLGAAMLDTETGRSSWILRCKSDVFSLQFDYSGNTVKCGLRNGAIVMVDTRQRPQELPARLTRHRIPLPCTTTSEPSRGSSKNITKQWFEFRGNMHHSSTISMPSSISCLSSLKLYDQYFIGSSMDGSIKLYDCRFSQRGAVQSYEGNVNSHTRIQLGIDPSERFLVSGGEDCYMRMWSIKSGEMLFEENFTNSVPQVVCWPQGGTTEKQDDHGRNNRSGFWLASQEGVFSVDYQ